MSREDSLPDINSIGPIEEAMFPQKNSLEEDLFPARESDTSLENDLFPKKNDSSLEDQLFPQRSLEDDLFPENKPLEDELFPIKTENLLDDELFPSKDKQIPVLPTAEKKTNFKVIFEQLSKSLSNETTRRQMIAVISQSVSEKGMRSEDVENVMTRLDEAVQRDDLYGKYRVIDFFDQVKRAVGTDFSSLMDALGTHGLTNEVVEKYREDAMLKDVDIQNLEAYVKTASTSGTVKDVYDLSLQKLKEVGGDVTKLSPLEIYLISLSSRHLLGSTKLEETETRNTILEETKTVSGNIDAVRKVQEATKDLTGVEKEQIMALLKKIQSGEALSEEEEALKKKHSSIFEPGKNEEQKTENQSTPETRVEKMSDEEKFEVVMDELAQMAEKINLMEEKKQKGEEVDNAERNASIIHYAKLIVLGSQLASQIADEQTGGNILREGKLSETTKDKYKEIMDALRGEIWSTIPEIFNGQSEKYDGKEYMKFRQNFSPTESEFENVTPKEEKEILEKLLDEEFGERLIKQKILKNEVIPEKEIKDLKLDESISAINEIAARISSEKSFRELKDVYARLLLHFDELIDRQGIKGDRREELKKQLKTPVFFEVRPIFEQELNGYKKTLVQEQVPAAGEPQTVEEAKKSSTEKRFRFSKRAIKIGLAGGLVALTMLGSGILGRIQAEMSNSAGARPSPVPAGEVLPGQMPTQGETVGGITWANAQKEIEKQASNLQQGAKAAQQIGQNVQKGIEGIFGGSPATAATTSPTKPTEGSQNNENKTLQSVKIGIPGENSYPTWGDFWKDYARKQGVDITGIIWSDKFNSVWDATQKAQGRNLSNDRTHAEAGLERVTNGNVTQEMIDAFNQFKSSL